MDDNSAVSDHQIATEMLSGVEPVVIESIGDRTSRIVATGEADLLNFNEWRRIGTWEK